jgi:D-serine deaminase-like pyridoxal phosphate-dependent protein
MELTVPHVNGVESLRTPALVIDLDAVSDNITATLRLLGGQPDRWRPHLKTAKLALVMRALVERGVRQAKCSTTLELETACKAGFSDLLLAYPVTEPHAEMVRRIAKAYPGVKISVLVEDPGMLAAFRGSHVGVFIDLNPGMDRTGMRLESYGEILALAREIGAARLRYAGLHFYDGHAHAFEPHEAERLVHAGYDRLLDLVSRLRADGIDTPEVITAGTPAFPHALGYSRFTEAGVIHRTSPGTVVYNDRKSLTQLPADAGYRPAALVLSRVVSHPGPSRFCADAGHKSVSADAGIPTCEVLGHPGFLPRQPSEEHLPVDVPKGERVPARGELVWLLPSHVCPTVNNFDHAVIVAGGAVRGIERVTARGRHAPME